MIKVKNSLNLGELIDTPTNINALRRSDLDCSFFNPRDAVSITNHRVTLNKSLQLKPKFTFTEETSLPIKANQAIRPSPSRLELTMRSTHKQNTPSSLSIGGGGNGFKVLKKRTRLSPMLQGQFLKRHEQGVFGP